MGAGEGSYPRLYWLVCGGVAVRVALGVLELDDQSGEDSGSGEGYRYPALQQ